VSEFRGKETTLTYRLESHEAQQLVFVGRKKEFDRLGDELIGKMTTALEALPRA